MKIEPTFPTKNILEEDNEYENNVTKEKSIDTYYTPRKVYQ